VEQQEAEHGARTLTLDGHDTPVLDDLEPSEDPELHVTVVALSASGE
jgi:hypothetical protein